MGTFVSAGVYSCIPPCWMRPISLPRCAVYVAGFSERSRIVTKLDIPPSLAGLSKDAELSIFRVVQECLTNIHHHAGSPTAEIRVTQQETCLRVEIEDSGKGISPEKEPAFGSSAHTGVGLRGMKERLRQLGVRNHRW
ncbi:MAG TPA: ATP-binding protein [Candidatus Sulfotelmatobacter sp.]|nr:ATP-binding protein [Candidatus Sulfotelmatobacter sp.]